MSRKDDEEDRPEKFQCTQCKGKGQVVQPVTLVNPRTGKTTVKEMAGQCPGCSGMGEV
jgi:hypothetical protein